MKKNCIYIVSAFTLFALISCEKEVFVNEPEVIETESPSQALIPMTFEAIADNSFNTKTALNGLEVTWAASENIYVFDGTAPRLFTSTSSGSQVTFTGNALSNSSYYAVYPAGTISGTTVSSKIPVFQDATANSFADGSGISVAYTTVSPTGDKVLRFKNVGAVVKFKVTDSDITKVRLDAIGGEKISGKVNVVFDGEGNFTTNIVDAEAYSCVVMNSASTLATDKDYYFVIYPGTYTGGFRLTLFNTAGKHKSFKNTTSNTLAKNELMDFGTIPAVTSWKDGATSYFDESFDSCAGSGGNDDVYSGSVGASDLNTDETWSSTSKCGGASECLKFGTSSDNCTLTTSTLSITGSATLTFRAAGWGSGTNTLEVSASGASVSGDTDITLSNGSWDNYTVNITSGTGSVAITFSGKRGFLDDVQIVSGDSSINDPVEAASSFSVIEVTPSNKSVGPKNATASFVINTTIPWTLDLTDDDSAIKSYSLSADGASRTKVSITFNDLASGEKTATFTVTPYTGIAVDVELTQTSSYTAYYEPATTSTVTSSGDLPKGASATYADTYTGNKFQVTKNNSATLTLSGYEGATITGIILNMHSNGSAGAGKFSVKAGSTTLASISSATNFNSWYDNKSYGTDWRDVTVTLTNSTYEIKKDEDVVIKIEGTTNSLFIDKYTIIYSL